MKTRYIFSTMLAAVMGLTLTACDENDWNNDLDGFEDQKDQPISNKQNIEYTLTADDYKAIASNATNKALAGDEFKADLAAVATRQAFSDAIPAEKYLPAFLASNSFKYFTLTDGSGVKVTYNVAGPVAPEVSEAAAAQQYTVSTDDYKAYVWESEDNFIDGFAPSHPANKYLGKILKNEADANDGLYCKVSYAQSEQEPVFGNVGGGETPSFTLSDVIGSVKVDDQVEINAVVTAVCGQGYVITDNSGSIFVYMGSSFDAKSQAVGNQVKVNGTIGAYNKGFQVTGASAEVEIVGTQAVTYPAAKSYTAAEWDQLITRTENELAVYATIKGKVTVTERNINVKPEGTEKAQGSVYGITDALRGLFTNDGEASITGYFIAIAGGRFCNFVVTAVDGKTVTAAPRRHNAPAVAVPTTGYNAMYRFNGDNWVAASGFCVLNPGDYTAMGQKYQNLTEPAKYLPRYLAAKYPYAQPGESTNVAYLYYDSKAKVTSYACDPYICGEDGVWTLNTGITAVTNQFVRNAGKWMYDPCVTITLPAGKGQELSTKYYQACVNWVYENICVPLGDTDIKSGKFYVSSYGNNEYYSGTSAYQGNVDLRPSAAKGQYPAEYQDMDDAAVVALEKTRFMNEVMPGALATLHADAVPVAGIDVIYTINFYAYDGASTALYTARFRVTAPGKFEPIDCTWDAK